MKKIGIISLTLLFCLTITVQTQAQLLNKIGKKLEKKAEEIIDNNKTGSKTSTSNEPVTKSSGTQTGPFQNIPALENDFTRGSEEIFFDSFEDDIIGKMGSKWTSNGTGAVQQVEGFEGKWLKLFDANTYKIKELIRIPENFTIEFDLLTLSSTKNNFAIDFGFDYQRGVGKHYYLADRNPVNVEASYRFNRFSFKSNEYSPTKVSEIEANMSYFVNDVMKVKLMVEGDRMSAYINEYKILDTEMIDPMTKKYFYLAVENDKNEAGVFIKNVRINKL